MRRARRLCTTPHSGGIAMLCGCWWRPGPTLTLSMSNSARHLRGGPLSICGEWADFWALSSPTLPSRFRTETRNGLRVCYDVFPALRQAKDTQGKPFRILAEESSNLEIRRMFEESARQGPEWS